jgi:hypothetical protein
MKTYSSEADADLVARPVARRQQTRSLHRHIPVGTAVLLQSVEVPVRKGYLSRHSVDFD